MMDTTTEQTSLRSFAVFFCEREGDGVIFARTVKASDEQNATDVFWATEEGDTRWEICFVTDP